MKTWTVRNNTSAEVIFIMAPASAVAAAIAKAAKGWTDVTVSREGRTRHYPAGWPVMGVIDSQ